MIGSIAGKLKQGSYAVCCVMTGLITAAWLTSYFVYFQFASATKYDLVFVKSSNAVLHYNEVQVENPEAPVDSPYTTVFGREADERLHRDLVYSISKMRELTPRRYVFNLAPPTGWWAIDPVSAVKQISQTGRVRNAMGTRTNVVLPYSVLLWVFATWPVVRWWKRRRQRRQLARAENEPG